MDTGTIQAIQHIIKTPGIVGGSARVDGRRIAVRQIVMLYDRQKTPVSEIVDMYELTAAQVYAALAYYHDNQDEIDSEIAEVEQLEAEAVISEWQKRIEAKSNIDPVDTDPGREMTTTEVAQRYNISDATVRQAIGKGAVKARKSGSTWLIRASDAYLRWGRHLDK